MERQHFFAKTLLIHGPLRVLTHVQVEDECVVFIEHERAIFARLQELNLSAVAEARVLVLLCPFLTLEGAGRLRRRYLEAGRVGALVEVFGGLSAFSSRRHGCRARGWPERSQLEPEVLHLEIARVDADIALETDDARRVHAICSRVHDTVFVLFVVAHAIEMNGLTSPATLSSQRIHRAITIIIDFARPDKTPKDDANKEYHEGRN